MPFIPHTPEETRDMLALIGAGQIEDLFDEIPTELMKNRLRSVPEGMNEMQVTRLMKERAAQDGCPLCFAGAGAYEHHIPAAIWQLVSRGEYYTAYTPYQAEASQGTLQLIYEYQTMMARLTGMDVSNASLYDGASALAEAVLMAVRANRKSKSRKILLPRSIHPAYRKVLKNIVETQDVALEEIDFDLASGKTALSSLQACEGKDICALVIPMPNFFGVLEDVEEMTDWAAAQGALSIAVCNPIALALLKPPGEWGEKGVDIAVGEGQPLGVPMSSGGPYFGFMCSRMELVRQMPGRLVGRTTDIEGREGFTLTLQAREQHIRRAKATSNICTNQGLVVAAATIYMAMLGPEGLSRVASASHANHNLLVDKIQAIPGVKPVFSGATFHEALFSLPKPADKLIEELARENIVAGYDVNKEYPELGHALLVCVTETKSEGDIEHFVEKLKAHLSDEPA